MLKKTKILIGILALGIILVGSWSWYWWKFGRAKIILVPENFQNIQEAINQARPGDIIRIGPGTYYGIKNFRTESYKGAVDLTGILLKKGVNLEGAGVSETIITKNPERNNELNTVGIMALGKNTIARLTIKDVEVGILCANESNRIEKNELRSNHKGILCENSSVTVKNNIIESNADNGLLFKKSKVIIKNNLIENNGGTDGLHLMDSSGKIINNIISENKPAGIRLSNSSPVIKNNIIVNNTKNIESFKGENYPLISYNNVWTNPFQHPEFVNFGGNYFGLDDLTGREGNISQDPNFGENYQLEHYSPCKDAGDPSRKYKDKDGTRNDMGIYGGSDSWPFERRQKILEEFIGAVSIVGPSQKFEFFNSLPNRDLVIVLNWPEATGQPDSSVSTLDFKIHKPDGDLYNEWKSSNPPLTVTISDAEEGRWKMEVMAIAVPYDEYPFAIVIATKD